ncbi:S41 family peptidase [Kribbella sp. NPDC056951]|uniref:S41 family peptidase n=1 Tax=Kribbella sp. NPDC056951 TaxID=3345978 RepID=UPI0036341CB9
MITATVAAVAALLSLDGVYQTDGYNIAVAISNGTAQFYDLTKVSCAPSDTATEVRPGVFESEDSRYRISPHSLQVDGSVGTIRLRPRPALPARCAVETPSDPLSVFDVFWASYAENYPAFRLKGVDWQVERARVRPLIHDGISDDKLFELMAGMLEPLGDAHVGLRSPEHAYSGVRPGTELPSDELEARAQALIHKDLRGAKLTSYGSLQYADLPGRIGYLRITSFDEDLDDALDTIFRKPLLGLMIDLRVNPGGSDPFGLRLASRLTNKPYVAYRKSTLVTAPQSIRVHPSRRPSYRGPIAVLTSGATVSAAESTTLALDGRSPRPIRYGESTQGAFSDTMIRTLPNGWLIAVPAERYVSASGRNYEGVGLPPHRATPAFDSSTFEAALRELRR